MGLEKTSNTPRAWQGPRACFCMAKAVHVPRAMLGKCRGSDSLLAPCPPQIHPLQSPRRGEGILLFSLQQQTGISMPPALAAGHRLKSRLHKISPNITTPKQSQTVIEDGRGGEKEPFFSPSHPGHRVSQGSGNRGAGPAPPAPQARPRRVRKVREGLPTSSWRRWWSFHHVEKCFSVSWPHAYLSKTHPKSKYCRETEQHLHTIKFSWISGGTWGSPAWGGGFLLGWWGWGESEKGGRKGIWLSGRRALMFGKPFPTGRTSPSSSCCFDIRYRFMSSVGKHETRKGQILTLNRQGKHWPSPGSTVI